MKFASVVATALLSSLASSAPVFEVVDARNALPKGWVKHDVAPASDAVLNMKIHLQQQNQQEFEQKLLAISTPGNSQYGEHMSTEAIKDMLRPASHTIEAVRNWLESYGIIDDVNVDSDWMYFKTTVAKAEELLKAKYENFRDLESGSITTRSLSYSLPTHIKSHIGMIHPTTSFALARPQKSTVHYRKPVPEALGHLDAQAAVTCASSVTPACLASLYGYGNYKPASIKAKMGVAGFLEEYPQKADLKSFLTKYDTNISSSTSFTCTLVNGGLCSTTTNTNNIVEANLDIQYAVAISSTIPVTYYSVGGRPPYQNNTGTNDNEPYLEFLNYLLNLTDAQLPTTVSISYGDTEYTVPKDYANTVCNLFAQIGARGVSVLAASGDGGADCDASGTLDPIFPGGCPYVTTVGATTGQGPEKAVDFSGGGFSNYFARPSYQNASVSAWIAGNYSPLLKGRYNASGRAFPDVAAQGNNFHVYIAGSDQLVGGTSASTPTFASIIDLVSNALLAQGKKPLGFLNPFLYSSTAKQGLTDITGGTTEGCSGVDNGNGFTAVAGWDPATGLGTPKFAGLIAAAGTSV